MKFIVAIGILCLLVCAAIRVFSGPRFIPGLTHDAILAYQFEPPMEIRNGGYFRLNDYSGFNRIELYCGSNLIETLNYVEPIQGAKLEQIEGYLRNEMRYPSFKWLTTSCHIEHFLIIGNKLLWKPYEIR